MGMFDDLRCHYPLPREGANTLAYQTKDTPAQWMDLYEIRADGSLWHETYDIEDRSDPSATGLDALRGSMTRVGKRWEPVKLTGEVRFYTSQPSGEWIEFSAYFIDGQLRELVDISQERT